MVLIITCEHAGNIVPKKLEPLFEKSLKRLNSHEGYDIGAIDLARKIANGCHASLFYSKVSRLVVELNRSLHSSELFSSVTKKLDVESKNLLIEKYYNPFREDVVDLIDLLILEKVQVFHVSVHTFTPVLKGEKRECDIGILFDPKRSVEKSFSTALRDVILEENDELNIRFNYPYKGTSDGFTTALRKRYKQSRYVGIELEVNQKFPLGDKKQWEALQKNIAASLKTLFL